MVGKAGLWLAGPGLDVAMDQLPSPWPLGAPAGKDICQRESWHLYFLLNLGLFLSHSFLSLLFFCSSSSLYNSNSFSSAHVLLITLSFSKLSLFIHLFDLFPLLQILKSLNRQSISSILLCIPSVHFRVDNILALHRVFQPTELKPEGILEDSNTVQPSSPGLGVKFCSHFLVCSNLLLFCFIHFF